MIIEGLEVNKILKQFQVVLLLANSFHCSASAKKLIAISTNKSFDILIKEKNISVSQYSYYRRLRVRNYRKRNVVDKDPSYREW